MWYVLYTMEGRKTLFGSTLLSTALRFCDRVEAQGATDVLLGNRKHVMECL